MMNKSLVKTPMRTLDANYRSTCFEEVSLGYDLEEAILEANRCLECKHKPCVSMCPVKIEIPHFIHEIKEKNIEKAYDIISDASLLPGVCGRVCPQEAQCESVCVRNIKGESVGIGRLERFVADYMMKEKRSSYSKIIDRNEKVAIVGSGPAGLSCAHDLRKLGYQVTLFEALHTFGGVLLYGIPEFRLPKEIVDLEVEKLARMGVELKKNTIIGKTMTLDDLLLDGFNAVFMGTGAGLPKFLGIPGEMLSGVYTANEYLTRVNLMKAYQKKSITPIHVGKKIAVVGGGNVAMDAARSAKRLGAKDVYIVYRRTLEDMPARLEEVHHAIEEGITCLTLSHPIEIFGNEDHFVKGMRCVKMALGEIDASGRRKPYVIEGSEFDLEVDDVIIAIGTTPNPLIKLTTPSLSTDRHGCITIDQNGQTSIRGVYAGGDVVTGSATVISAMEAGRKAAHSINQYLNGLT